MAIFYTKYRLDSRVIRYGYSLAETGDFNPDLVIEIETP